MINGLKLRLPRDDDPTLLLLLLLQYLHSLVQQQQRPATPANCGEAEEEVEAAPQ